MISVAAFEHFYISWMFFFIKKKLGEKKFKRKCSILMSLPQQWLAAHRNPQVVQTLLILLFLSPRLSTEFLINRLKKFCFLCVRITVQVTVSPASCPGLRPDGTPDRGRESKNSQQGKENTMTLGWQVRSASAVRKWVLCRKKHEASSTHSVCQEKGCAVCLKWDIFIISHMFGLIVQDVLNLLGKYLEQHL